MKPTLLTFFIFYFSLLSAQVPPLINNNWQTYQWPYNAYFPDDSSGVNGKMGNGCFITAMSRLIHYWQFPNNGLNKLDFTDYEGYYWYCNYEELDLDYSKMPYELSENATQEEYDETAKLFYACGAMGASIRVGWEGGIDSLVRVLPYYWKYDTTLEVVRRWNYTRSEWINMFKNELDNGRPILIGGRTIDSPPPWEPGNYEGHFFACDGYNSDGDFYTKYSFGGIQGYFDIDSMHMFPAYHEALIKIQPVSTGIGIDKPSPISIKIHPNPLTEFSEIVFNTTKGQPVQIDMFDMKGRHIKMIYKGVIYPGQTRIRISNKEIKSGVYIFKVFSNNQSIARKIINM